MRLFPWQRHAQRSNRALDAGFTLMDMLTTLSLIAIISGVAASNINQLENPLADASYQVSRFTRLARSRAISQTMSIQIQPSSTTEILAYSSESCSGPMTLLSDLSLTLPDGATLSNTAWSACFTARGLSNTNVTFSLQNQKGTSKTIEIALGGGVQIR